MTHPLTIAAMRRRGQWRETFRSECLLEAQQASLEAIATMQAEGWEVSHAASLRDGTDHLIIINMTRSE